MTVHLRPYRAADAAWTLDVFRAAVTRTASAFYTPDQIDAWCPPTHDAAAWASRRAEAWTIVAEVDGHLVGFSDLTRDGALDMLYVRPAAGHQGVARQLVTAVLEEARRRGLPRVTTRASRAARGPFERFGFVLDCENANNLARGVVVPNYSMHIDLS